MADGWEGDDHVDFLCSCVSERLDDVSAAGLANDLFAALGCWLNETAEASLSTVAVFHQSLLDWDAALFRVAERCWSSGVRNGNDYVCFERVFSGEDPAELSSCFVHVVVIDLAAWVTEVGVLERAVVVAWGVCESCYFEPVFGQTDKLARLNISDKVCLESCEGAALARHDVSVRVGIVSKTEGSVACFVPGRQNLAIMGYYYEAVGAAQLFAQLVKRAGPVAFRTVVLQETVSSELRVSRRT